MKSDIRCRLCDQVATYVFSAKKQFGVAYNYYRCTFCESLQTQKPTWLAEVYAEGALGSLDTGVVYRTQQMAARFWLLSKLIGIDRGKTILDFGGSTGLFTRQIRDLGFDAYSEDKHTKPIFASDFCLNADVDSLDVITAFEVMEHFDEPKTQAADIFGRGADYVFVSTALYDGQAKDWYYLVPESGQHVFFYSQKAMRLIAQKYGYYCVSTKYFTFFSTSQLQKFERALFVIICSSLAARIGMAILSLLGRPGRDADFVEIMSRQTHDE